MSKKLIEKIIRNVEERLEQDKQISKDLEETNRQLTENLEKISDHKSNKS